MFFSIGLLCIQTLFLHQEFFKVFYCWVKTLKIRVKLILNCPRAHAITYTYGSFLLQNVLLRTYYFVVE